MNEEEFVERVKEEMNWTQEQWRHYLVEQCKKSKPLDLDENDVRLMVERIKKNISQT